MQTRKVNGEANVVELPGIKGKGVAPVTIPEINKAANAYCKARDHRMKATDDEVDAKDKLKKVIHKHDGKLSKDKDGSIIYKFEDQVIILSPGKEDVKVKSVHQKP